ncbi:hypothetical protein [Mucilaginibacter sp.]|uniref:hypothetical protein n=1 Tax=Mucilaginibacter sp. TaxID=1882438 RepID=UPI00262192D1|nr:hypothetical protein [Mucilaginibacter sp.]MDB4919638.1 hypothetical protein [Mucilaginibacter sp.]
MITFTICSNNYLAEAITLGNSLEKNGFDPTKYFIFLVDELSSDIDYNAGNYDIIKIIDEIVPGFIMLTQKYNIIELSTSVKPSVFKYLISLYSNESLFVYFDPDLYFFQDAYSFIASEIENHSILLTPHVTRPVPLNIQPFENTFLNYGIYNLGFIAIKADDNSFKMLNWWEERTLDLGIADVKNGYFVDQLWMNLVPGFFDGVKITNHLGFNTAYWNLNERTVQKMNDLYYVNKNVPLVFFHFSSFDFSLLHLSKRKHTSPAVNNDVLMELMIVYKDKLIENNYPYYKKYKPAYKLSYGNYIEREMPGTANTKKVLVIKKLKKFVPKKLLRRLANLNHIVETLDKYNNV